jgi:hypothetical protein
MAIGLELRGKILKVDAKHALPTFSSEIVVSRELSLQRAPASTLASHTKPHQHQHLTTADWSHRIRYDVKFLG